VSAISSTARGRLRRYGVVALAAAAVTGCSIDLHPGQAAVVNGDRISQSSVDDSVQAACAFLEVSNAENPQATGIAITDLRSSFTGAFVSVEIFRELLDERGLTVTPADIARTASQNTIPDELDEDDAELLQTFFDDIAEISLSDALVQANEADSSITDSSQLTGDEQSDPGSTVVTDFFAAQDVEVNPQYGQWDGEWDGNPVTFASGSLSKPVSDTAQPLVPDPQTGNTDTSSLPPTQVCG